VRTALIVAALALTGVIAADVTDAIGSSNKAQRRGALRDMDDCGAITMQLAYDDGALFRMDADGTHRRRVTRQAAFHPAWSPDGAWIAFDREASGTGAPGDIYLVGADGERPRRLTRSRDSFLPAWSPSGRQIYFEGLNTGGFFRINADGSSRRRLPRSSFPDAWSPDGRQFATATKTGIVVVNADGSGRRQITRGDATNVTWSPEGEQIAFVTGRGFTGIALVNADGSGRRQLTHGQDTQLAWSSDGTRIAFLGSRGNLVVVNVATGALHQLTRLREPNLTYNPEWSPDGNWIAFAHWAALPLWGNHVYVIKSDGTRLHDLGTGVDPTWRPCPG
jgi:Tol biopolymer transport system component